MPGKKGAAKAANAKTTKPEDSAPAPAAKEAKTAKVEVATEDIEPARATKVAKVVKPAAASEDMGLAPSAAKGAKVAKVVKSGAASRDIDPALVEDLGLVSDHGEADEPESNGPRKGKQNARTKAVEVNGDSAGNKKGKKPGATATVPVTLKEVSSRKVDPPTRTNPPRGCKVQVKYEDAKK